jgi:GxxExxY protein
VQFEPIPPETEAVAANVIEAAFRVHRALGPGLLESAYEACVCHELGKLGVPFERQIDVPLEYDGVRLGIGLRLDLLVGERVVVELKAIERIQPLHEAQLLTYMKLTGVRLGLLLNFDVKQLKDGMVRMVL